MGSGTFGVCVKNLNANYFGSELNKETFEMAKKRINNNNQLKIKL
jgi:DNA modification methylase